ncbi:MAG: ERAP1-like C-terminal domain-containing protein [Gemmatimonadetes bacterium]|nr:ERAP1-like C-terminal domain-containing protein [Gemmatimonadota bacterium]
MSQRALLVATGLALLGASACTPAPRDPEPGVARALAEQRAQAISDLHYQVDLYVPAERDSAVTGEITISFALSDARRPLVLDFRAPRDHVRRVRLDGDSVAYSLPEDHIVIPASALSEGVHTVTVGFRSTDAALNRNADFLYALFVPDRASTAFPVFEQPDLKARFRLAISIPAGWQALSNGAETRRERVTVVSSTGGMLEEPTRETIFFAETEPISTYLFAFAAGRMQVERAVRDGRTFTMYHRETDAAKLARNRDAIFDLHATALRWLEEYTGIPYPFGKFDFFAVPSFQFGGMEHPGAIWYRADGLFLDPTATRNQELGRASLIAHETAHMWFGDLVTMRWFNDVWMKEVFANFMAAKIAGPAFPDINLDLRFFQAHHPTAYGVDRTAGANPIRQELENLREAGSLYGAIIYQKAPIVMKQLEQLVGEEAMRDGLREYLAQHRFGNATWPDLIAVLDARTPEDLAAWSRAWVEEPRRPRITARWADSGVVLAQRDPLPGRALRWTQPIVLAFDSAGTVASRRVALREAQVFVPMPGVTSPSFILPGADGVGYGRFLLDSTSRATLLARTTTLRDPVQRAVAWQTLHEEMLDGFLPPATLLESGLAALAAEREELVQLQVLGLVRGVYWRFLSDSVRRAIAPRVEAALWRELDRAPTPGRKGAFFSAIVGSTLTAEGTARLERIWNKAETPRGLPLAEQQYIGLAEALAIRGVPNAERILDEQEGRVTNPDRQQRMRFMRAALSADVRVRDSLFATFREVENRRRESWVLDAMAAMNHPLRATAALPNLTASLDLVLPIQQTGDIFFPLRWLNATLDGHQSAAAASAVEAFLAAHPDYPPRLRGKVLQAADDLYRSATIVEGWTPAAGRARPAARP